MTKKPEVTPLAKMVHRSLDKGRGLPMGENVKKADTKDQTIFVESDLRQVHQINWAAICMDIAIQRGEGTEKQGFWITMANRVRQAQQFDFGPVEDIRIKSEAERAGPLFGDGHLSIPYDAVVYNYTMIPDPKDTPEDMIGKTVRFTTLAARVDPEVWTKNPAEGQMIMAADFLFVPGSEFADGHHVKRKWVAILAGGCVFQSATEEGRWYGRLVDAAQGRGTVNEQLVSIADGVGSLSMILATKGVQARTHKPSEKQQRARIKRGKPPIPIVTKVNTQKYYEAMQNVEKGHHASPVPHLRRGHIRRLGEDRTTWVRDCIVNCKTLDSEFSREKYEVE